MFLFSSAPRSMPLAALTLGLLSALGCSNASGGSGVVSGPADDHCKSVPAQATSQDNCHLTDPDAGPVMADYGDPLYGDEGDDDDCKYHVKWSATPVAQNQDVTFTLTTTYKIDGQPNPPACSGCAVKDLNTDNTYAEVFLNQLHPAPPTKQTVTQGQPGTYAIGPIRFDASGKWTVRFHLFEDCTDVSEDSPHGHAAFFVDVP